MTEVTFTNPDVIPPIYFSELRVGDWFEDIDTGHIFIKRNNDFRNSAVRVAPAQNWDFSQGRLVRPLKTVTISFTYK